MHIENMKQAIATAVMVHENKLPFNINDWYKDSINPMDCNTAACMLGWITRQQWAQDAGMQVQEEGIEYTDKYGIVWDGFEAGAMLLDISYHQSVWLFGYEAYGDNPSEVTAEDVMIRMQYLLDENAPETQFAPSPSEGAKASDGYQEIDFMLEDDFLRETVGRIFNPVSSR